MKRLVIHPKDSTTDFLKPIYHGRSDTTVMTGGYIEDVQEQIEKHDHIIMLGHGTPQGLLSMGQFRSRPLAPSANDEPDDEFAQIDLPDMKELYELDDEAWFGTGSRDDTPSYGQEELAGLAPAGATPIRPSKKTSYTMHKDRPLYPSQKKSYKSYLSELTTSYVIDDDTAPLLRGKKLTAIWCNADQYMEWNDLGGFYTGMFISEPAEAKMIGTSDTEKWQIEESNYGFVSVVRRFVDRPDDKLRNMLMLEYGEMAKRNAVAKYNLRRLYMRLEGAE